MTTQAQLDTALAPFGDSVRQYNWRIDASSYIAFVTNRMSCRDEVAKAVEPFDHLKIGVPARAPNGFADYHPIKVQGVMPRWRSR